MSMTGKYVAEEVGLQFRVGVRDTFDQIAHVHDLHTMTEKTVGC